MLFGIGLIFCPIVWTIVSTVAIIDVCKPLFYIFKNPYKMFCVLAYFAVPKHGIFCRTMLQFFPLAERVAVLYVL